MDILEKIDAAIQRISHGRAPMRIPVDETDVDIVLDECQKEIERLNAELAECKKDSERLDLLQWMTTRVNYQNAARPTESVGTTMHFQSNLCSIYVSDLFGNVIPGGAACSENVRYAIDAIAALAALSKEK